MLFIVLGGLIEEGSPAQVSLAGVMIYVGVAFAGWAIALRRRGATFADAGFRWAGGGPLLVAIPVVGGLVIVTFAVLSLTDLLIGGVPTAQDQVAPGDTTLTRADLYWLLLVGAIAAPVVEEFFFRGLLFPYLRARSALWLAVFLSSALFAVMHFVPPLIPALLAFGAVEALVFQRYKSLYPAMLVHGINNAFLLVGVYTYLK